MMNRQTHSAREEEESPLQSSGAEVLDPKSHRFPLCVVWCPIPILTWILPFVGHAAIGASDGTLYDFQGDLSVHQDKDTTYFGKVTKYWVLDLSKSNVQDSAEFDSVLSRSVDTFSHKYYNFFTNNCHDFVGETLNAIEYEGRSNWASVTLVLGLFRHAHYVGPSQFFKTYGPFFVLLVLIGLLIWLFCLV